MNKRLIALLLSLTLVLPVFALAEGGEWICTECGKKNSENFCSNCGAPRPAGNGKTEVNENLEQIPGETDKVKVIAGGAEASSYIKPRKEPTKWVPENVIDGNKSTCWQFSAKKGLAGNWIDLIFDAAETVDELWIRNGFQGVNDKGKSQYGINSRPKTIVISFLTEGGKEYGDAVEATLKDDENGWQHISTGRHEKVSKVRVSVKSIYTGSDFEHDVCISDLMAVQNAPAAGAMPAQEEQAEVVYESRPDITGCNLLMKLATRSGPGTQYSEPGTFFGKNWKQQTVKVLKKSFDGSIWWVQVDFQNGSKSKYRVWTGVKRVDVDLNKVKEETSLGSGDIKPTSDTYWGPGGKYAKAKIKIRKGAEMIIYGRENGYLDVEYWYRDGNYKPNRVWIPESAAVGIEWGNNHSGE